jgi:putative Mg2+ transporter-C (MgtC) family protein
MEELFYLGQITLALLLGGILGWQRERWGKSAGPRTYGLVTAGSTLFTILSVNAFGVSEASRVAAQIIVGIGFLGAGTIIHRENHVEGLTTAAGFWMVAAIGMAIGVQYFILATGATLLMLIVLTFNDHRFQKNNLETGAPFIPPPQPATTTKKIKNRSL